MDPVEKETEEVEEDTTTTEEKATDKPKLVPISELIETRNKLKDAKKQLESYEADKKAKDLESMTEVDRLKAENTTLKESISTYEVGTKKQAAFLKAKSAIGDQYELPAATEAKLLEKIGKLSYDENEIDADIADLVEMAKRPRTTGKSVLNTTEETSKAAKSARDYTAQELNKLQTENPEKFKKVMQERRASVGFGPAKQTKK